MVKSKVASSHGKRNEARSSWLYVVLRWLNIAARSSIMCMSQNVRRAHSRSRAFVLRISDEYSSCSGRVVAEETEGSRMGCRMRNAWSVGLCKRNEINGLREAPQEHPYRRELSFQTCPPRCKFCVLEAGQVPGQPPLP